MAKKIQIFAIAFVIIALLAAFVIVNGNYTSISQPDEPSNPSPTLTDIILSPTPTATPPIVENAVLHVIFLDVGQADCILLKTNDHAMLIDAGNTGQDKLVLGYLNEYKVTKLDYLVATHPHADHIGSMTAVVKAMDSIGTVIMPNRPHTTKTYENLLKAIEEKDISIAMPEPGDVFTLGDANIEVLAPADAGKQKDLNECSIVLRVEFGDIVFLFTGDAGTESETEQLAHGFSLKADVLKVGHHGSRTSSSQKYLNAVAPSYVVISCGAGNTYGHPHKEAMTRLTGTGATIYRTDEKGTIIFMTDGKEITVSFGSGIGTKPGSAGTEMTYVGNKNSKILHLTSCGSLPQETNRVYFETRQEAIDAGYTPCNSCKP